MADYLIRYDWRKFRSANNKNETRKDSTGIELTPDCYPKTWDKPIEWTPDNMRWRWVNWLTNLESSIAKEDYATNRKIYDEIDKAGLIDSVPDELLLTYAPNLNNFINQNKAR